MDNYEVKLMCSYGGTIRYPSPGNKLSYSDGETKVLYVNRNISLSAMFDKLRNICRERVMKFKYLFPGGKDDQVILVTVDDHDDLENMMREYDKLNNDSVTAPVMRLFISLPLEGLNRGFIL